MAPAPPDSNPGAGAAQKISLCLADRFSPRSQEFRRIYDRAPPTPFRRIIGQIAGYQVVHLSSQSNAEKRFVIRIWQFKAPLCDCINRQSIHSKLEQNIADLF